MRHIIVRAAVLASLLGATIAYAVSTGPPVSRTGAFAVANKAAEANCTVCHSGSPLNDPSGSLHILDLPTQYVPGQTYNIRLVLSHTWTPPRPDSTLWGFELTAVQATTGDSAGTWILPPNAPPDTFQVKKPGSGAYRNRRYIMHTRAGMDSFSTQFHSALHWKAQGSVTWNLKWQAPPGDSGKIYFFAAGNSANDDGQSFGSGDFIYTTAESTVAGPTVGVPHPSPLDLRFALDDPSPNPFNKCANIDFTIPGGGLVDLAIYDLQGRRVRTILHEYRPAGTHGTFWNGRKDDGGNAPDGIYFLRLHVPGEPKVLSRKLTLSR